MESSPIFLCREYFPKTWMSSSLVNWWSNSSLLGTTIYPFRLHLSYQTKMGMILSLQQTGGLTRSFLAPPFILFVFIPLTKPKIGMILSLQETCGCSILKKWHKTILSSLEPNTTLDSSLDFGGSAERHHRSYWLLALV